MRHNKKFNHLGRKASHRGSMLSNMASSLIKHKRITTTVAKAKALRKYIEPLLTKAKEDTTHSRRVVFSNLQDKIAVTELFKEISVKIADRPGGYTRIIKTGNRLGDNASMCFMELVDYDENMAKDAAKKATRTRRRSKKTSSVETPAQETPVQSEEISKLDAVAGEEKEVSAVEEIKESKVEEKNAEAPAKPVSKKGVAKKTTIKKATEEVKADKAE